MTEKETPTAASALATKAILAVVLALAGIGLGVSIELSRIHFFTHTDPTYHSVCAINEDINCETVAQSPYSVFLGLPISVWGMMAYSLFIVLSLWGLTPLRLHGRWPLGAFFALFSAALACSLTLAYVSFFRIDSMCLFCAALYVVNLVLFAVVVFAFVRARLNPVRAILDDILALSRRPITALAAVVLAASVLVAVELSFPTYWIHVKLGDLPDLPHGEQEGGGHWIGAKRPIVTVTEFSDYECPFCRTAYNNARSWSAEFPDEVRLIHRHQPLDSACNPDVSRRMHPRACEFAKAAECAGEQGRFWEMSDALYSVQDTVRSGEVDVELLAVRIGLDRSGFLECMESTRPMRHIRADIKAAKKRGVRGTPTFFINSQPYVGGFSRDILAGSVEAARERQKNAN